jgi:hypothetical protein
MLSQGNHRSVFMRPSVADFAVQHRQETRRTSRKPRGRAELLAERLRERYVKRAGRRSGAPNFGRCWRIEATPDDASE